MWVWMARLQIKAIECKYKEYVRRSKEQFKNEINNEATTVKIIEKMTFLRDTSEVNSQQVIGWTKRVETLRTQKEVSNKVRDTKDFDSIIRDRQNPG